MSGNLPGDDINIDGFLSMLRHFKFKNNTKILIFLISSV